MNKNIRQIASLGLFTGLLIIATSVLRFPVPTFNLYFNLGEAVIYLVALMYGGPAGAIVGGAGSAIADLLAGYPVWAPITLVIKGLEGYVVGAASRKIKPAYAVTLGAVIMMAGYATAAGILYGIGAVPIEVAGDFVQVFAGGLISLFLYNRLKQYFVIDKD